MKRLALLVAAAVGGMFWLGMGVSPAYADNGPHYPSAGNLTVDRCAGCHRTHTGQAEYLLKEAQPALCYTCHGAAAGGASTDVQDGLGYPGFERGSGAKGLRGGGFEFAVIDSGHAARSAPGVSPSWKTVPVLVDKEPTTSHHTVNGEEGTAWGNGAISETANPGATIELRCGTCHDPHGNGAYRILRPIPTDSGATAPITVPDTPVKVYTTDNYWAADDPNSPIVTEPVVRPDRYGVPTNYYPTQFNYNITKWCTQCHTRYLASNGSYETDSGDALFMYRHRSDQDYRAGGANCITCHVAHGTNAKMSGYNSGKATDPGATTPVGSSKLLRVDNRGTCNMCHSV